jgi:hypothetical protein
MKRTIEIECPKGQKPVYKDGKIIFVNELSMEDIKNSSIACGILSVDEINKLRYQRDRLFTLLTIIKALNKEFSNGNKISLTKDCVFYPHFYFYTKERNNSIRFKHDGKIYYLEGDHAFFGSGDGIGKFDFKHGISNSDVDFGLLGCATLEIAKYVSKTFPKLLFDALYYGKIDYEWLD